MGSIVPFRIAAQRQADATWAIVQAQIRQRTCADCETLREESERIRRNYEERRKTIGRLLADLQRNSERA